jgi:hypothetical protein
MPRGMAPNGLFASESKHSKTSAATRADAHLEDSDLLGWVRRCLLGFRARRKVAFADLNVRTFAAVDGNLTE